MSAVPLSTADVRAALKRVAARRDAGDEVEGDSPDVGTLLATIPAWELELEGRFGRLGCAACRDSVPACWALFHALSCPLIPSVARAKKAELELRAFGHLAHLLGDTLDCWAEGGLCTLATERAFPRTRIVFAREVNDALVLLAGPSGEFLPHRPSTPMSLDELGQQRGANPRPVLPPATAVEVLEQVLDGKECEGVLSRGTCIGCGRRVGAADLVAHLTGCPDHPELRRAAKLEKRLEEIRGDAPNVLASHVDRLNRHRHALLMLLTKCEWVDAEMGWDGEAAYLDSWLEQELNEGVKAAHAVLQGGA